MINQSNLFPSFLITTFLVMFVSSTRVQAEEGGSGHYLPGSIASFMDGVSPDPTFIARLNYVNYDGGMGANRALPIAGLTALNVNAKSNALGLTLFWAPEWGQSGKWSYAMSTTIPWLSMEVSADVKTHGITVRKSDKETGLGDIILMPLMFNYHHSADLNTNYRIAIYAPTGNYEVGRLANTGKNFWTIEPTFGFNYLGQKNGREVSFFIGVDFNTKNNATDYKSGTQVHFDGTLAQHFPLWGGFASIGATGFLYRQVTGDSGDGAILGDFKGRANGVGPVASWASKVGNADLITEFKWLHEFDNRNRPEGDTVFLKIMAKF